MSDDTPRRPEAYHQKLLEAEARHTAEAASAEAPREAGSSVGGPTHGAAVAMAVATKEAGLGSVLTYDGWERRSGLVHLHDQGVAPTDVATGRARGLVRPDGPCRIVELGDDQVRLERAATDSFRGLDASITTTIAVGGDRLTPTLMFSLEVANRAATPLETRVGVSWDLMLLGGGGNPAAYHEIDRNGCIRKVNHTECEWLGYSESELLGRPIWELVAENERALEKHLLA